jgi:hypothetical protein
VYIVTDLINALPGNGKVKTFRRATLKIVSQWTNVLALCQVTASAPMDGRDNNHVTCVFYVVRAEPVERGSVVA